MKYKLIEKEPVQIIKQVQICIRCGTGRIYEHKVYANGPPRPRPNTTMYFGTPTRLQCLLGNHHYYFEDEVKRV